MCAFCIISFVVGLMAANEFVYLVRFSRLSPNRKTTYHLKNAKTSKITKQPCLYNQPFKRILPYTIQHVHGHPNWIDYIFSYIVYIVTNAPPKITYFTTTNYHSTKSNQSLIHNISSINPNHPTSYLPHQFSFFLSNSSLLHGAHTTPI